MYSSWPGIQEQGFPRSLKIDDTVDIDFRGSKIHLWTLKRKKPFKRTVAVPPIVTTEVATYLAEWPNMVSYIGKALYVETFNSL